MANKNLLTYGAKASAVEQLYYSPVAVVPPFVNVPLGTTYAFLSKADPWGDENNPDQPEQTQKYLKQIFKNMFVAKLVTSSDISPVIERIDWSANTTYSYYTDDVDLFERDINGSLVNKFYVKNRYDQIFKCLWNNNDQPSTEEPYFEPGTFNTNNIYQGSDGYKWKFIYTIDMGLKVKFMDKTWIPVSVGSNTPNPLVTSAGSGNIDVINVLNGGSGYDPANAAITITIDGDGTGATAVADVNAGVLQDIIVVNTGSNYSYANITVTSSAGSNAVAIAPTSPIGGHGFDPLSELGCAHVMITSQFTGDEGGDLPTDIDFHQLGLVVNPVSQSSWQAAQSDGVTSPYPANGQIYRTTTDCVVAPGFGSYTQDETIYQGASSTDASFKAKVLSFDVATNVVRLINIQGTPANNTPIFGETSKTVRTLLSYSEPNFTIFSGYISYIENRTGVQRSADGIEQIRIVLGY